MFEWKNEFSVNIGSIDAQHRNLFSIAQELYDAMSAGKGKSSCARILDRLVQYTIVHFAHEERMMKQNGYPELTAHRAQHEALTQQVLKFQSDLDTGRVTLTVQLLTFLRRWLEKHIMVSDMGFSRHLAQVAPVAASPPSQTS